MAIVLQETLRGVFYAPFYAALSLGAYAREGVEVRFTSARTPSNSARGLADGTVDVTWGGPMRVMLTYDQDPTCDLVCFCEVVTRDPFFLLGREPRPGFQLSELMGLRVATVSEVPTPWLCLQEDMRRARTGPRQARPHRRPVDGGELRRPGARRGRCRAGLPALRRGAGRVGRRTCLAGGGHARPDLLHHALCPPRAARRAPRGMPAHGSRPPFHLEVGACRHRRAARRGHRRLFPGRPANAPRQRARPLQGAGPVGPRPASPTLGLRAPQSGPRLRRPGEGRSTLRDRRRQQPCRARHPRRPTGAHRADAFKHRGSRT